MAERADVVHAREKKDIKNSSIHPTVPVTRVADVEAPWLPNAKANANANAPRLDVANSPNDNGV